MDKFEGKGPKFSPLIYKAVLLSIMLAAFIVPLAWVASPYIEFFNGMAVQPKAKAQMAYGWGLEEQTLADWKPVEGTIPRDYQPHVFAGADPKAGDDYQKIIDEAGETLINPTEPTIENLKRGQKIYNIYCITCHGKVGNGDGPVVGPDRFPAPTSLHAENIKAYKDGAFYQVITAGKNAMPGYASKIRSEDRWKVVHYVRVLQISQDPPMKDNIE